MNFATKLVVSLVTIAGTIVGSLWGAFEINDARMDRKDKEVKKEVLTIVYNLKDERNALLKAQDDKVAVQLQALTNEMSEVRKDVRAILRISRTKQVVLENLRNQNYTKIEPLKKGNNI